MMECMCIYISIYVSVYLSIRDKALLYFDCPAGMVYAAEETLWFTGKVRETPFIYMSIHVWIVRSR